MSYAKLFRDILDSTVWVGTSKHVKLAWITILAMKDVDGIVSASVPGLAKEAEITIAECEDALEKFLSPDPHSRTKDNDGRRLDVIDGGWRVLNHDKYRDKEDRDEIRRKAAERQARRRDRLASRDVTLGHAESREVPDTDPDPHADLGEEDLPPARAHAIPPSTEPTPVPATEPPAEPPTELQQQLEATAQQLANDEPARQARNAIADAAWKNLNRLRREVAAELGIAGVRELHPMDHGRRALSQRIRECPSLAEAEESVAHVLAVISAEARASRTVQWLSGSAFEERSWRTAIAKTVADAARPRSGPRGSDSRGTPSPVTPRKLKSL